MNGQAPPSRGIVTTMCTHTGGVNRELEPHKQGHPDDPHDAHSEEGRSICRICEAVAETASGALVTHREETLQQRAFAATGHRQRRPVLRVLRVGKCLSVKIDNPWGQVHLRLKGF